MSIAIIGGGIGGLTTALALKKANIPFTLYEATPEIKPVGAGIVMASNALQVFRCLGIHEEIYKKGNRIDAMTISKADFSPLSKISLASFKKKYGLQNHAIHRSDLHNILADAVGHEHIVLGKRLKTIEKEERRYKLTFECGTTIDSKHVIGADGIRSQVRQQLFSENTYRDSGQVCYRGVLKYKLPEEFRHEALEAWERGKRFGFTQISDGVVYWYLVLDKSLYYKSLQPCNVEGLFHPLAVDMISKTAKDNIFFSKISDLKPIYTWSKEGVCLIGDAAHATTPNIGQGACQAVEDAYILGELLKKYPVDEAFAKYPEIRRKKAHDVVNTSWKIGKISHASNPVMAWLRDFIFRITPQSINLKQMDKVFMLNNNE